MADRALTPTWILFAAILIVLGARLPKGVRGHGRLLEPPSRASMWRLGYNTPVDYHDNQLFCGGFRVQWVENGGRCGVCGDPWNAPRDHEVGGQYSRGVVVRRYERGQSIEVTVELTAAHRGQFEFRVCPYLDPGTEVTQDCLDRYPLAIVGRSGETGYEVKGHEASTHRLMVHLPLQLTCARCLFQWKYRAGNSWGVDGETGRSCLGCGPQEEFYGCSDISIGLRGSGDHRGSSVDHSLLRFEALGSNENREEDDDDDDADDDYDDDVIRFQSNEIRKNIPVVTSSNSTSSDDGKRRNDVTSIDATSLSSSSSSSSSSADRFEYSPGGASGPSVGLHRGEGASEGPRETLPPSEPLFNGGDNDDRSNFRSSDEDWTQMTVEGHLYNVSVLSSSGQPPDSFSGALDPRESFQVDGGTMFLFPGWIVIKDDNRRRIVLAEERFVEDLIRMKAEVETGSAQRRLKNSEQEEARTSIEESADQETLRAENWTIVTHRGEELTAGEKNDTAFKVIRKKTIKELTEQSDGEREPSPTPPSSSSSPPPLSFPYPISHSTTTFKPLPPIHMEPIHRERSGSNEVKGQRPQQPPSSLSPPTPSTTSVPSTSFPPKTSPHLPPIPPATTVDYSRLLQRILFHQNKN